MTKTGWHLATKKEKKCGRLQHEIDEDEYAAR